MLTEEQTEFRDLACDLAREIAPQYDLDWRLMAAAAILESGWGQSNLARDANNFFGVKAGPATPDDRAHLLRTPNGPERFRRYDDVGESFHAYGRLVGGARLYCAARRAARAAALETMTRTLAPRYCPDDPDYATKILQIVAMIDDEAA